MNNIVYLTGVPTPRYRVQRIRQNLDQDLFVDFLANHPEHLARSKAKGERIVAQRRRELEERRRREARRERLYDGMFLTAAGSLTAAVALVGMLLQ